MDTQARVTVIMSTNRRSPYLAEALESVRAQTVDAWEIVLLDNGSPVPDEIRAVAAGVPRCRVVREQGHVVSIPLNHGLALARTEYVTFLDDDDVWEPRRLEVLLDRLDADPGLGGVYSSVDFIDGQGRRKGPLFVAANESPRDLLSGRYPFPNIVSFVFRRTDLIRVGGFNPAFRYAEDTDLTFRMLQYARIEGVPEVLTLYRRHDDNVTAVRATALHDASRRMIRMQSWGAENHADPTIAADIRANRRALDARDAHDSVEHGLSSLRRGDVTGATRLLARAARLDPGVAVREASRRIARKARRGD